MPSTKISSKSQIVIPAEVRRQLGLETGDVLQVEIDGNCVGLRKEADSWLARLATFRGKHWEAASEELQRERERWDERQQSAEEW